MDATRTTPDDLAAVIEDLYAGTLDDTAWDRGILGVADLMRASGALLFAVNPSNRAILRDERHRVDPDVLEAYRRHWVQHDCRLPHFMPAPVGTPVTEHLLPPADWKRSPILNEFLLPADLPHFMPVWLHKASRKYVTLSLQGSRRRGPFDSRDMETFRQVVPHVARALEIRDRLEQAQVARVLAPPSLDTLHYGVIALDASGRMLAANRVAEAALRAPASGLQRRPDGSVWLRGPAGAQLARWLATGIPPAQLADGLLHIARMNAAPLSVLVSRIPAGRCAWTTQDACWLLLLFDPDLLVPADAQLIAADLGISPREAQISALLLSGMSLRAIAQHCAVSTHTVRAQLKSIYRKTGIGTQAELVRRVALGPAVQASLSPVG